MPHRLHNIHGLVQPITYGATLTTLNALRNQTEAALYRLHQVRDTWAIYSVHMHT